MAAGHERRPKRTDEMPPEDPESDRLLPSEQESLRSGRLDDAIHWQTVYGELFEFKQNLLATLVEQRSTIADDGRPEIDNDAIILTREADRLSRRLEFWRGEVAARRG